MRKLWTLFSCVALLVVFAALPAFADSDGHDGELLGSGQEAPVDDDKPAKPEPAPEPEPVDTAEVTDSGEQLASTGLDSATVALIGVGLTGAGGAAVLATRRRKSSS